MDVMLWSGQGVKEFFDVGTLGNVPRVTGGQVTYLKGGEAGSAETASHLREQLAGALRDHSHSANEAVLKVSLSVGIHLFRRLEIHIRRIQRKVVVSVVG